jgi:hypothetical protein
MFSGYIKSLFFFWFGGGGVSNRVSDASPWHIRSYT